MSELRSVSLASLHSNPFRDLEEFPFIQGKLDRLQESIEAEGFWEGVIARPAKSGYEIAFGHHRVYAAQRALGDDAKVPVIVRDLDDEQMLRFMQRENAEEFGHDFYNTDVQTVRAAVLYLGSHEERPKGWPETEAKTNASALRAAPSFQVCGVVLYPASQTYTAASLAEFLGRTNPVDGKTCREILTALDVLELLEAGAMKPRAIMGLDHGAVREVVVAAKQAAERARREAEEREEKAAKERAAKERMAQLDAERKEREHERKVKEDGAAKARKEQAEADAARRKYEAEQEASRKAALEAKRTADKAVIDARIAAAKETSEKLKTKTITEVRDERKTKQLVSPPPRRTPSRSVDLSPRIVRLQDDAARLAANAEEFVALARDPGNAVSVRDLRKLATLLGECGSKGRDVARLAEKRGKR